MTHSHTLTQSEFYILFSLAIKERHGYEIMKQVEHDSGQKVRLGPGTLYGSIKRLLQEGLIEEVTGDHPRRKYYTLTESGRHWLSLELQRYKDAVELADEKNLFETFDIVQVGL